MLCSITLVSIEFQFHFSSTSPARCFTHRASDQTRRLSTSPVIPNRVSKLPLLSVSLRTSLYNRLNVLKNSAPDSSSETYFVCRGPRGIRCSGRSWGCSEAGAPRAADWRPAGDWYRRPGSPRGSSAAPGCSCSRPSFSRPFFSRSLGRSRCDRSIYDDSLALAPVPLASKPVGPSDARSRSSRTCYFWGRTLDF